MGKTNEEINEYEVINILDLIESVGEDNAKNFLSDFSCSINKEIEEFLHNQAIDYAKKAISITYLVLNKKSQIAGYFAITHKATTIPKNKISNSLAKKLSLRIDVAPSNEYTASAFLIAQFGKDTTINMDGNILMKIVVSILQNIQQQIGGKLIFLECTNVDNLLKFYKRHNFIIYNERLSRKNNVKLIQLLNYLKP